MGKKIIFFIFGTPCLLLALAAQAGGAPDPQRRAREVALRLPFAHDAFLQLRREAASISDPALRAAVEAQLLAPWLPAEAWAFAHLEQARKLLAEPRLELPPPHRGDFLAAPGGPCDRGPHGHPGGLAVSSLSQLLQSRALASAYKRLYGVEPRADYLLAASIWQDALLAATLPYRPDGSCGPEPAIAGAPAHHVLGLAVALLRHLPKDLIAAIAAANGADAACRSLQAASVIANGESTSCPALPVEAALAHAARADRDYTASTWSKYAASAPKGWDRYEALIQDGNDVKLFSRSP